MRLLYSVALALAMTLPAPQVRAQSLDLLFRPPVLDAPQMVCRPPAPEPSVGAVSQSPGNDVLTDTQRIAFLERDIRRLQVADPEGQFVFINALISRLEALDDGFAGDGALLARVSLYSDAAKFDALREAGYLDQLRARAAQLTNNRKMLLAQYYLNGIGVERDLAFAHGLIRDAGLAGNADALLNIARMELDGRPLPDWSAPLDVTVTLAFGGLLGALDEGICARAEKIARLYEGGDLVKPNPDLAYDWTKFAADLGSAEAAWRVVEHHLGADSARKNNAEMLVYLKRAAEGGIVVPDAQLDQLRITGDASIRVVLDMLGYNHSAVAGRTRPSVSSLFKLGVNLDSDIVADRESAYVAYLRELATLDGAPAWVFTGLAGEIELRRGRWAGEDEILALLEQAAAQKDPDGMRILAQKLVRWRDSGPQVNRVADLLTETVSRFGSAAAMNDLDRLYRCQVNTAPHLAEAEVWARSYAATGHAVVGVSAPDLVALDPHKQPFLLAKMQSEALDGRVQSVANLLQRLQLDPMASTNAHRVWAARADRSPKALEAFALLEFDLATNPTERTLAVELFRRIHLNNGVTTALDLAVALIKDSASDPKVAAEVLTLLTRAGQRGEGAAIRLKARLLGGQVPARDVFEEFAEVIDARGDFLANMFAIPFVPRDRAADYLDRAVSLMRCNTKDVSELAEAHALIGDTAGAHHWLQVGLALERGNVLSRLGLSDAQAQSYAEGDIPGAREVQLRLLAEGDMQAHRALYDLAADRALETYDPEAAADHLLALVASSRPADQDWVLNTYRRAEATVQQRVNERFDINHLYRSAARTGDPAAKTEYALLLRANAKTPAELETSAILLAEAAEAGHPEAMAEWGYMLAHGLGATRDEATALDWLDLASAAGQTAAGELAGLLRLSRP